MGKVKAKRMIVTAMIERMKAENTKVVAANAKLSAQVKYDRLIKVVYRKRLQATIQHSQKIYQNILDVYVKLMAQATNDLEIEVRRETQPLSDHDVMKFRDLKSVQIEKKIAALEKENLSMDRHVKTLEDMLFRDDD